MSRMIAACLICTICVIGSNAQDESAPAPAKRVQVAQEVPFLISEEDGKPVWKLSGSVEFSLGELISAWVRSTGHSMPVQAAQFRYPVSYEAPASGVTFKGERITSFVSDILAQFRLALVGVSSGHAQIVQSAEAGTYAATVNTAELAKVADYEWVVWYGSLRFADANAMRAAVQNLMSRQGGMISPVSGTNALMISDRADRVRQIVKMVEALDASGQGERLLEKYDLPEGVDAVGAASALKILLREVGVSGHKGSMDPSLDIGVVPGKSRLLVLGTAQQQAEVKKAIDLMK